MNGLASLKSMERIEKKRVKKPLKIQTGTFEYRGKHIPIIETLSVTEQKEWIESGGTIDELIQLILESA